MIGELAAGTRNRMTSIRTAHTDQNIILSRQISSDVPFSFAPKLRSNYDVDALELMIRIYSQRGANSDKCVFSVCVRYVQSNVSVLLKPSDVRVVACERIGICIGFTFRLSLVQLPTFKLRPQERFISIEMDVNNIEYVLVAEMLDLAPMAQMIDYNVLF